MVYQIYPRSFADSNGDGVGDLGGVISKLGYLELLGVDAIWLSPVMRSPMADHGYDVSDRATSTLFGDLAELDRLVADAHSRDIRVAMDLVPNHTSVEHPWFAGRSLQAAAARPGHATTSATDKDPTAVPAQQLGERLRRSRVVADHRTLTGRPVSGTLHLFAPEQPDVNFDNPEVVADLEQTLRFWLDRGIDGFRIDVAHGLAKAPASRHGPRHGDRVAAHRLRPAVQQPAGPPDPPAHPCGRRRIPRRVHRRRGVGGRQRPVRRIPAAR